jgi:endoglucanase
MLAGASQAAPLELHHGVGLHQWLNWSPLAADGSYRWPPYRSVEEWLGEDRPASDWPPGDPFVAIKALGFDFVRLTVDPGPLLASDGANRDEALKVLSESFKRLTEANLKVVFNLHSVTQVAQYGVDVINGPANSEAIARYEAMSADVARMLLSFGTDNVAFEPYNEPAHYPCDASGSEDWQTIMTATVKAVRAVSSELTLVATGACGGSITGLTDLKPEFDDPNILYSFHMYEPHSFSHQRSDIEGDFASGLPWPASAGSPEAVVAMLRAHMDAAGLSEAEQARNLDAVGGAIDEYFAEDWGPKQMEARVGEAVSWAKANGIPTERLFMGEFGAILMSADGRMGAFNPDRLRYLEALRREAERYDIPWAIWEYSNPYGMSVIEPKGPAVADVDLLRALGLPAAP